jgi:hypothetical protein
VDSIDVTPTRDVNGCDEKKNYFSKSTKRPEIKV